MSDKRKKQKFAAKRKDRVERQAAEEGAWRASKGLPGGWVAADLTQHAPYNSCSPPPTYYADVEFTCRDCGEAEAWTAKEQKWYYEVIKGTLFAKAVRCSSCRKKVREQKAIQRQQMEAADKKRSQS